MTVSELILVRHGESEGNVASAAADLAEAETIDIADRDADVPLSELGRAQAAAVGRWLATVPPVEQPTAVVASPYVRARDTAELALAAAGLELLPVRLDERLRDRELGILDRLTGRGVAAQFPAEAGRRRHLGKFYYRPPGGESWADVALRLRSLLGELTDPHRADLGPRALLATHDAVILLIRFVLERRTEGELMDIARGGSVRNASITRLVRDEPSEPWRPVLFNDVEHLADCRVPATAHPGKPA